MKSYINRLTMKWFSEVSNIFCPLGQKMFPTASISSRMDGSFGALLRVWDIIVLRMIFHKSLKERLITQPKQQRLCKKCAILFVGEQTILNFIVFIKNHYIETLQQGFFLFCVIKQVKWTETKVWTKCMRANLLCYIFNFDLNVHFE